MFDGFARVMRVTATIGAVLLVLFGIGVANNKGLRGMAAVGAGLADVLKWTGALLSQALSRL